MALVQRFSPIGNLNDLTTDAQLGDWNREVESLMSKFVGQLERATGRGNSQFVDPSIVDMGGASASSISWNGFPASLAAAGFTRDECYKITDGLLKDNRGLTGRDTQDEYLEWYTQRDDANDIVQIDFTTEGPEYWTTLATDLDQADLLALYQRFYPDCKASDLFKGGSYEPRNVFNTTRGAMHLIQQNNFLEAEVGIAALSTLTYTRNGVTLTSGADLCQYAQLGVSTRNSDPHIAEVVNQLAREGRRLTLQDPIGLYMSAAPDFTGWTTPDGSDPAGLWKIERGNPPTRGTLRSAANFKLSQVTIAGQPIQYGGQVADRVTVNLTALLSGPNTITPTVVPVDKTAMKAPKLTMAFALLQRPQSRSGR